MSESRKSLKKRKGFAVVDRWKWKLSYEDEFEMRKRQRTSKREGDKEDTESNVSWRTSSAGLTFVEYKQMCHGMAGRDNPSNCWAMIQTLLPKKYSKASAELWTRVIQTIPEHILQNNREMCSLAVQHGVPLRCIPLRHRTLQNCFTAVRHGRDEDLANIPRQFIARATQEPQFRAELQKLYLCAIKANGKAIRLVPENLQTQEMALLALKSTCSAAKYIAPEFKTKEACAAWVNHADWNPELGMIEVFPEQVWTGALCVKVFSKFAFKRRSKSRNGGSDSDSESKQEELEYPNLWLYMSPNMLQAAVVHAQNQSHCGRDWLTRLPEIAEADAQRVTRTMWLVYVRVPVLWDHADRKELRERLVFVPAEHRTREIIEAAVSLRGLELCSVPAHKRDQPLCKLAIESFVRGSFENEIHNTWRHIPPQCLGDSLIDLAMSIPKCAAVVFPLLPLALRNRQRCLLAVRALPQLFSTVHLQASEMQDDEIALAAAAYSQNHAIISNKQLANPDWIRKAILTLDNHKIIAKLLRHIPAQLRQSFDSLAELRTRSLLKDRATLNDSYVWQELFPRNKPHNDIEKLITTLRLSIREYTVEFFKSDNLDAHDKITLALASLCGTCGRGGCAAFFWIHYMPIEMCTEQMFRRWASITPEAIGCAKNILKCCKRDVDSGIQEAWLTPDLCLSALERAATWHFAVRDGNPNKHLARAETENLVDLFLRPPWILSEQQANILNTLNTEWYEDWQELWRVHKKRNGDFGVDWIRTALLPSVPDVWRADVCIAWHVRLQIKYGPKHPFLRCHVPACRAKCLKRIRHVFSLMSTLAGVCSDSIMLTLTFL